MKQHKLALTISSLITVLLISCAFLQFGPHELSTQRDYLLTCTIMPDGSQLYAVEHWTGSYLEPYAVRLYRVDRDTNVFVCFLGDEYNYWWGCQLLRMDGSDSIKMTAFGTTQGYFSISNGFTWISEPRPVSPNWLIDGRKVTTPIPDFVLQGKN